MGRRPIMLALISAAVALVFLAGVTRLFVLRFERGDVYPEYSSLRADPLGAKALFESIAALPELTVERNYGPPEQLGARGPAAVFCLRATVDGLDEPVPAAEFTPFEGVAAAGGRAVISFFPVAREPEDFSEVPDGLWGRRDRDEDEGEDEGEDEDRAPEGDASQGDETDAEEAEEEGDSQVAADDEDAGAGAAGEEEEGEDEDEDDARCPWAEPDVSIADRWGVKLAFADLEQDEYGFYTSLTALRVAPEQPGGTTVDALPAAISCHTALYFAAPDGEWGPDSPWRAVYEREPGRPVIIERDYGPGTIVLCADSYFFSNEAMLDERHPELLAWLIGPYSRVVFDEAHLGVMERRGVMWLARRYRLQGVLLVFVVLAGLFAWQNAARFVPALPEGAAPNGGEWATGKDSAAGLKNLLRRSIRPADLLVVCIEEWKKSFAHDGAARKRKLERMQAAVAAERARPSNERNPVECYRAICRIVSEKE